MRKTNFSRKTVVAVSATMVLAAIPTAFMAYGTIVDPSSNPKDSYCLQLTEDPTGSLAGAGYIGEATYVDSDNVTHNLGTFGFNLNIESVGTDEYDNDGNYVNTTYEDKITYVALTSLKVGDDNENVYLPDRISVDYNGKTLTSDVYNVVFNYYTPEQGNTELNSFIDSPDLKNVYVGTSTSNVTWSGEDFLKIRNFHFRSEEVPNFNFYSGSNGTINIYVPETLFAHYTDVIDGASYTATVWSEDPLSPTYVNVDIPGTLADAISSNIENLNEVRWLVVTGTPNEQDLRMMRRLPRLEILDLSATTGLTTIVGCNGMKYLREVKFPDGITSIGEESFKNCTAIDEIEIPASVKEIKSRAFQYSSIRVINLENVEYIGENSFEYSRIAKIDISSAKKVDYSAFYNCHALESAKFPNIIDIMNYSFYNCNLSKIEVPNSCKFIGWSAFEYNSNLKEIEIGTGINDINAAAFRGCPIEKYTIRTLFPSSHSGCNENTDLSKATLYVPALTLNEYLLADGWAVFENVKPLEEELTDITIDRTFMLTSDKGIAKNATLRLISGDYMMGNYGHLTVRRNINAPLNLGNYYQGGTKSISEWWGNNGYEHRYYYYGSTLIPYSEITADNVELKLTLQTGRWHFISLPFDVKVSDIKTTDEALWVVRKYSGADRAELKESTWQNMTEATVLKAGEGYIFHCAHDNTSEVEFTFIPASVESGNKLFAKEDVVKELTEYPSEYAHNASWNLVGNTFPAYLNINALGFEAPVTVYNGSSYIPYLPGDDDLVLEPFQAFFVQRQDFEGGDVITLHPEGRAHTQEECAALEIDRKKAPAVRTQRSLFNILINGESGMDRARVVVNENASMAYEKNRDASKFMSSEKEVPQIFVMNDSRRMAIDERPLGEGEINLGTYFGKSGEYIISLETRNAEEYTVLLIDNKVGIITDLTETEYTFQADADIDESRFTLMLKASTTSADAIEADTVKVNVEGSVLSIAAPEEIEITVVAADGKTIVSDRSDKFSVTLDKGIYAVKAGDVTTKVIVK